MEFDRIEALRIGQELKKIRKQRGLSLAEVETLSEGRWKAVVVGSYERADRAITIGRLSALMSFYQAPVSALFLQANQSSTSLKTNTPYAFDLSKRQELVQKYFGLSHFVTHIINLRGDWNGHILTIRASDLETLAICDGYTLNEYVENLQTNRLLLQWR